MKILVIDIGGSNVKLMMSLRGKRRKFSSGPRLTPAKFMAGVCSTIGDWKFDAVAIGFPAPIVQGRIAVEPKNLGRGWKRFNFRKAFGKPVRLINDAAMQALGSYRGGRMLFLGLGTGLGSALVWNGHVLSLELGDLPYINNQSVEDLIGDDGLEKLGTRRWRSHVRRIVSDLMKAFIADNVVLGGGNAKLLQEFPNGVVPGHNRNAFTGGVRLWQRAKHSRNGAWKII